MFVDDNTRIRHMLESASEAISFAGGRTRSDLDHDRMFTLALLKSVETVGEAAYRVTRDFRDAHPDIAWTALIKMRNSLVHDYHSVDLDALWSTVVTELPILVSKLAALVSE